MEQVATLKSHKMLFSNTLAFSVCFAVWMLNGLLVTFLVNNQVFDWGPVGVNRDSHVLVQKMTRVELG